MILITIWKKHTESQTQRVFTKYLFSMLISKISTKLTNHTYLKESLKLDTLAKHNLKAFLRSYICNMRARRSTKSRKLKPKCVVCNKNRCVDEVPKAVFKIHPGYDGRVTRSVTKILNYITNFIIVEIYRCMPLLGDEEEKAPNWDVHIVRYAIVFTNKS